MTLGPFKRYLELCKFLGFEKISDFTESEVRTFRYMGDYIFIEEGSTQGYVYLSLVQGEGLLFDKEMTSLDTEVH